MRNEKPLTLYCNIASLRWSGAEPEMPLRCPEWHTAPVLVRVCPSARTVRHSRPQAAGSLPFVRCPHTVYGPTWKRRHRAPPFLRPTSSLSTVPASLSALRQDPALGTLFSHPAFRAALERCRFQARGSRQCPLGETLRRLSWWAERR